MFRIKRETRKRKYMTYGLLPFEAHTLSIVPENRPYIKRLLKDRLILFTQAANERWSRKEYETKIKEIYGDKDWIIEDTKELQEFGTRRKSVGKADPWRMLRDYRKRAIDEGEYIPKPRKSHKGMRGELNEAAIQDGIRRKRLSELEKYAKGRGKE